MDQAQFPQDPHFTAQVPLNWPVQLERKGFRLPTEHEWEIACRAGTGSAYSFGSDESLLQHYAWFGTNSGGGGHEPRLLRPNLRGLFDMHGNVWEWCHDWHAPFPIDTTDDPIGAALRENRVYRSGSWDDRVGDCRSSRRFRHLPTGRYAGFGCRLVMGGL